MYVILSGNIWFVDPKFLLISSSISSLQSLGGGGGKCGEEAGTSSNALATPAADILTN